MTNKGDTWKVGIDLGTRYSCVGIWLSHHNRVEIITNSAGNRTTPSYVAFTPTGCLIGEGAKNQITTNSANTIYDLQRLVGRRFDDPVVQRGIKSWPFKVIKGSDGLPKIAVVNKGKEEKYSPEEISSMLLVELKNVAESFLGTTVKDVVITVPAYFNEYQTQATKFAAHLAGLDVLQIINDPVSAAIAAYGEEKKADEKNVLVFDLDDDAFDISLVTIEKDKLSVKATGSDTHFGYTEMVNIMVDHCVKEFKRKHKMDISGNLRALGRLRDHSDRAIQDMSTNFETTISVNGLLEGIDFCTTITRAKFEYINRDFFTKCIERLESFLKDKIKKNDVDDIVLVGRLTRIPKVPQLLRDFFKRNKLFNSIHPEEVVAYGATLVASNLSKEKSENAKAWDDVPDLSFGVDAHENCYSVISTPKTTPIPTETEHDYRTIEENINVNDDQGERSRAKENKWLGNGVTPTIGIDLGTKYSCVGVWHQDKVRILVNDQGDKSTPSFVSFTPTGCVIGEDAKNQILGNPTNTIFDAQRLVGRRFDDPEVQEGIKLWPFKVIKGTCGFPKIVVAYKGKEKKYSAEEISSMVLVELKNLAESFLGTTIKDAVITVPAYFNESQRQATKLAAHLAGLDVLQIIDEPVSAAIAYRLHLKTDASNVLIFDLDDDTFDVSLVTINEKRSLTVKAIGGDTHFGGQDIVNIMVDHFIMEFNKKHKKDLHGNGRALGMLRDRSKRAIQDLNVITKTSIYIDSSYEGIDFCSTITRGTFEHINSSFFSKCIETVSSCLRDAKINKTDVDYIVLVGGYARMPKVQELLRDFFDGKDLCKNIHPKEVVAYGATVLARNLSREKCEKAKNLPLVDVVPLSLGVNAHDGVFSVIIPRNTPIPTEKESIYFTTRDNQDSISFNIYQGERSRAEDNNWLGNFEVIVSPAPKGKSKVRVVFSVDADGTLNCWVKEFTTGLKKMIMIDNDKVKRSEEEIEKMMNDAVRNRLVDREYKQIMCARNALEEYIYNVKRRMKTIGSTDKTRLHEEEIKKMDNVIEVANRYLDGNPEHADVDEYQKVLNQLEKLCVGVIAQLV